MSTIRMARAEDASALAGMNRIFNKNSVDPDAICESLRHAQELVAVAVRRGTHAGFVCAQVHDSFCYRAPYAEITELFVGEKYRRSGLATKLISFMEHQLAKRGVVHLHILTAVRNKPARMLYQKLGYRRANPEVLYEKNMPARTRHCSRVSLKTGARPGKAKQIVGADRKDTV